jgi:DNA repair protein RadC
LPTVTSVRNLPAMDRPRERLLTGGAQVLTNQELLALIINSGTRRASSIDLAERLLSRWQSLRSLADASVEEIMQVSGIGTAKAASLLAALELGRRLMAQQGEVRPAIRGAADVANLIMPRLRDLAWEEFLAILLNTKHKVIEVKTVSVGHLNGTLVHPRELFRESVRRSAAAIILAHNHPSGDPEPSSDDLALTHRLQSAGQLLGIPVLDHIIIGDNRYVSLRERGLCEEY